MGMGTEVSTSEDLTAAVSARSSCHVLERFHGRELALGSRILTLSRWGWIQHPPICPGLGMSLVSPCLQVPLCSSKQVLRACPELRALGTNTAWGWGRMGLSRGMRATLSLLLQPHSPAGDPDEVLEVDRARREEQKDGEEQSPCRAGGQSASGSLGASL